MRRPRVLGALAAGLLLVTGCGAASTNSSGAAGSAQAMSNPNLDTGTSLGGRPAPGFRLVNQFGQPMSLREFRGKIVLLDFNDSECTTVCPLTTQAMVWAKRLLGSAGDGVQLLGIDANPTAISVRDVLSYSRAHGMVNQWDFLTGTLSQLKAVWHAYGIAVQIQQGQIDHTPALFVIDQRGGLQKVYLTQMAYSSVGQLAQVLAEEVASLLPGHPTPAGSQSLATISVQGPRQHVTLPSATSGSVRLGPGAPRMVMFFATWLTETGDLDGQLRVAGEYAAYAASHGLPGLTGVDETVTEPSEQAARAYIAARNLAFPVGLDTSGRVADGYGVQDQPWFALVNAAGAIVWSHDGWMTLAALETAAARR